MSKPKYINWEKCIHIHACRRFSKIIERKTGKKVSRGCGVNCEAFQESTDDVIDKVASLLCDTLNFRRWKNIEARGDDVERYQEIIDDNLDELAKIFEVKLHNRRMWDFDYDREYNDPVYDSPMREGYLERMKSYNKS